MATTITLEGAARTEFGKGAARRMRVANLIPATVYAGGEEFEKARKQILQRILGEAKANG